MNGANGINRFFSLYLDRFKGGRSGWLFGENPDIYNLGSYLPGLEEMVLHSLRAAGEE
jgi:hypothetical protein